MQILETSIYKGSGFSTYFFHTLIKQRQKRRSWAIAAVRTWFLGDRF